MTEVNYTLGSLKVDILAAKHVRSMLEGNNYSTQTVDYLIYDLKQLKKLMKKVGKKNAKRKL